MIHTCHLCSHMDTSSHRLRGPTEPAPSLPTTTTTPVSPHIPFHLRTTATLARSCLPNTLSSIPASEPQCWWPSPPGTLSSLVSTGWAPSLHAGLSSEVTSSEKRTLTSKSKPTPPGPSQAPLSHHLHCVAAPHGSPSRAEAVLSPQLPSSKRRRKACSGG